MTPTTRNPFLLLLHCTMRAFLGIPPLSFYSACSIHIAEYFFCCFYNAFKFHLQCIAFAVFIKHITQTTCGWHHSVILILLLFLHSCFTLISCSHIKKSCFYCFDIAYGLHFKISCFCCFTLNVADTFRYPATTVFALHMVKTFSAIFILHMAFFLQNLAFVDFDL